MIYAERCKGNDYKHVINKKLILPITDPSLYNFSTFIYVN